MSIVTDFFNNSTDDALLNHFNLEFMKMPTLEMKGITSDEIQKGIKYRLKTFNIFANNVPMYDIYYDGGRIARSKSVKEDAPTVSTSLRIDREWRYFIWLIKWRDAIFSKGDISENNLRASIKVTPESVQQKTREANDKPKISWLLEGVLLTKIPEVIFDFSTGDPLIMNIEFSYLDLKETFS